MINTSSLPDHFKPGVLYLILPDQKYVEFSHKNIRVFAEEYLDSPEKVPDNVRKAVDFQRCLVCPNALKEGYCHALYPSLVAFDIIDKYPSHEMVQVFFLDPKSNTLLTKKTSLQNALQFVSVLSLINYCDFGRQYHEYFYMVNPLMSTKEIASRIYLNAFWLFDGDKERTMGQLKRVAMGLSITIDCQVKRLRLICKNDAFLNAFVITHVLTDMLQMDLIKVVKENFEEHQRCIV